MKGAVQEDDLKTACTQDAANSERNTASERIWTALSINAMKLGSPRQKLSDDVQETLAKLLAACEDILNGTWDGNLNGFALTTLKRVRIDRFRKDTRNDNTVPLDEFEIQLTTPLELQSHLLPDLETRDLIKRLTPKLSAQERNVFVGLGSDMGTSKIAEELDIDASRVRQIRTQIKKKVLRLDPDLPVSKE